MELVTIAENHLKQSFALLRVKRITGTKTDTTFKRNIATGRERLNLSNLLGASVFDVE
jgi:hypothetical protein